jgi:hypothetical protein
MSNAILDQHPARIECHGRELAALIDAVRERGGIVEGMTHACPGIYRLSIFWKPLAQPSLIETENGA